MKKSILIKLHLYSGIFTSFYLLAFGFSAIILNHGIDVENKKITHTWESNVAIDTTFSDLQLAESIREQVALMGWLPRWEFKRDSSQFKFTIVHPGRKYHLTANASNGHLTIGESPKGILAVFHGLHFLNGNIPNAPLLIKSWAIYQWLALFVMTISMILGIWLWIKFSYKTWQGIAFGGLFIITILIMIMI
jgi:hypothetical protein